MAYKADDGCVGCAPAEGLGRRRFMELLALGLAGTLTGCALPTARGRAASTTTAARTKLVAAANSAASTTSTTTAPSTVAASSPFPNPNPGPPQVFWRAPGVSQQIALTIDDGFCQPCVEAYVEFAQRTGIHITFSPNGIYQSLWNPVASALKPLIATGQVQVANHTYTHADLTHLGSAGIGDELERNDEWIRSTFGITTRPWYRPPFGYRTVRTDDLAAQFGYTHVLMWNGSFGDAAVLTPSELLAQARRWLLPGTIMLGHANHPTIIDLLGQIHELIESRDLNPVTLDEMFGTSRSVG